MAVDRKQLKAFANKGVPGGGAHGGPPPTKQDKSSTGAKPPMDTNEGDDDDRFADLLPLLEKNAKDIEASSEELDPANLDSEDLPPEELSILKSGFAILDPDFQKAFESAASGGISREDAEGLADHLSSEGLVELPDNVAGWLYHAAKNGLQADTGGEAPDQDGGDDSDDDDDGDGGDDSDGGDDNQ